MSLLPDDEFYRFIHDPRLGKQRHIPKPKPALFKQKPKPALFTRVLVKKLRCGDCKGCKHDDCGACMNCADKPKFGGSGVRKQCCILKRCQSPIIERSLV